MSQIQQEEALQCTVIFLEGALQCTVIFLEEALQCTVIFIEGALQCSKSTTEITLQTQFGHGFSRYSDIGTRVLMNHHLLAEGQ